MNRRGFLGSIAAVAVAPLLPIPETEGISLSFIHEWEPKDLIAIMHPSGRVDYVPVAIKSWGRMTIEWSDDDFKA